MITLLGSAVVAIVASIVITISFWIMVIIAYSYHHPKPLSVFKTIDEARAERLDLEIERKQLLTDLQKQNVTNLVINGSSVTKGDDSHQINQGIAVNEQIVTNDLKMEDHGDLWICDNRPFWFGLLQQLPAMIVVIFLLIGYSVWPTYKSDSQIVIIIVSLLWLFWTIFLALRSYITVEPNFRLGVKRFGRQMDGFLTTGLNFVLPRPIESVYSVDLRTTEWGPNSESSLMEETHLGGSVSTEENPEPGLFVIPFLGRWQTNITLSMLLSVYKSDRSAWYDYETEYPHIDQAGQAMAQTILSVLTKYIREIDTSNGNGESNDDTAYILDSTIKMLNRIPESVVEVIQALHLMGPSQRGGYLVHRVSLTIKPGTELQDFLQSADKGSLGRHLEALKGEAIRNRFSKFKEYFEGVEDKELLATILDVEKTDQVRALYESLQKGNNSVVDLLMTLFTKNLGDKNNEEERR